MAEHARPPNGIPKKEEAVKLASSYVEKSKDNMDQVKHALTQWQTYLEELSAEKEQLSQVRSKGLFNDSNQLVFDSSKACTICLDKPKQIMFQCGHQCCADCSSKLEHCHTCRTAIQSRIRLFD
mmetsp:Transcript_44351/g.66853  ORF Transcript_44351/g.66853 Transcript_44351/m.66853 type:complete len:124 (+) Transcript_44351:2-373(+)